MATDSVHKALKLNSPFLDEFLLKPARDLFLRQWRDCYHGPELPTESLVKPVEVFVPAKKI